MKHHLRVLLAVGLVAVLCPGWLFAQVQDPKAFKLPGIQEKLATEIDTKDFTNPMIFKDFIALLRERCVGKGVELTVLIDLGSFREEKDDANPQEAPIQLPAVPGTMPVGQALRLAVAQLPGAMIVRNGVAEVVARPAATPQALLKQKVLARFEKALFADVLRQLSEMSGVSVLLDPRVQEKAQMSVSADFRGDVPLESALRMLANMGELRVVLMDGGAYITTPRNAETLEKQMRERKPEDKPK
jgi:hypothetical protein